MSTELSGLLDDIILNASLVQAWLVDSKDDQGRILARTRDTFATEGAAVSAAAVLVDALTQEAPGRVAAVSRGGEVEGDAWRGVVDLRLEDI